MGLIICIECNNHVSEYAKKCPNCGCPIKKTQVISNLERMRKRSRNFRIIVSVFLLLIGISLFIYPIQQRNSYLFDSFLNWWKLSISSDDGIIVEWAKSLTPIAISALDNGRIFTTPEKHDIINNNFDRLCDEVLNDMVISRQTPYFIFGVLSFICAYYTYKSAKKYMLNIQEDTDW